MDTTFDLPSSSDALTITYTGLFGIKITGIKFLLTMQRSLSQTRNYQIKIVQRLIILMVNALTQKICGVTEFLYCIVAPSEPIWVMETFCGRFL